MLFLLVEQLHRRLDGFWNLSELLVMRSSRSPCNDCFWNQSYVIPFPGPPHATDR
jgi:hypothetical protein